MEIGKHIRRPGQLTFEKIIFSLLLYITLPAASQPIGRPNITDTISHRAGEPQVDINIHVFAEDHAPLSFSDSEAKKIVLPYDDNIISFRVAAPDITESNQKTYFYKLEPVSNKWTQLSGNGLITFSNLPPRSYTLRVKTDEASGINGKKEIALSLIIQSPWWKTWWAYLSYLIVFIAMLYFIRKYELRRVLLRNQLRVEHLESEKLKELDRLKSRFFTNISHEFRTPLTLIMGPVEDLMKTGNAGQFKKILPEVHRNSQRLLQLTNQLLDLSKLNTNNYSINATKEDIIPFVSQILHSFHSLSEKRNIDLMLNVHPMLSEKLQAGETKFYFDEDMIEKIVDNLLSNAFKFTRELGKITVGMKIAEKKSNYLELSVKDSGIGIPPEKVPHIFDRFYQADDAHFEGSGVGLALIKELVELLHGEVAVESEAGAGTTFYCYLPLNNKIITQNTFDIDQKQPTITDEIISYEDVKPADSVPMDKSRPHILIVDDHPDVRKYVRGKLEAIYLVIEARNGAEGLETARSRMPDLVISDVMMPEMDGFELCKKLKTDNLTSHIPVILLTARAEDSDKMTGLETGADAYLIKPFNAQELNMRVKKLIELRKNLRAKFSSKLLVKPDEITVTSIDQAFMKQLVSIVENHISDAKFSVTGLSASMNMSTSQLSRKLKAIIDQSPQKFIQSKRMARAIELLKNNIGNISEVSWKVGYDDPAYFSRVFKNYFGYLPSEKDKFPEG